MWAFIDLRIKGEPGWSGSQPPPPGVAKPVFEFLPTKGLLAR